MKSLLPRDTEDPVEDAAVLRGLARLIVDELGLDGLGRGYYSRGLDDTGRNRTEEGADAALLREDILVGVVLDPEAHCGFWDREEQQSCQPGIVPYALKKQTQSAYLGDPSPSRCSLRRPSTYYS